MTDATDWNEPLSPQGRRRRTAIGEVARAAALQRRRRRRLGRATVAGFVLLLATAVFIQLQPSRLDRTPVQVVERIAPSAPPPALLISQIETEPAISQRLALSHGRRRWQTVGDDELLHTLAQAGHPAGLVTMNGQATLLTR